MEDSPIVAWVREHYEGVSLLALAAFMLWVRLQSYDSFVKDGKVLFSGNDPYYHLRETSYTVRNWPATMPYDVWTYYPIGTNSTQFGTLYDQLVATAALVVGLGSPSQQTIAMTLLVSPAVLGALVVFPAYYAGRRVGGVYGGMFGAVVLALLPGSILNRTLVGAADHQAIEVLMQMTTVLAFMVALGVAKQEKPVYELALDRDFEALRRPVGWSALAGVAMGLYVWTWPPSVLLIGVLGVFFALKMGSDYFNGRSPEPVAVVAAVGMTVAGVMAMLPASSVGFSPTEWSFLQSGGSFAVAGGAVFLAWLARRFDEEDLDRRLFPVSIGVAGVLGAAVLSVAAPDVWNTLANNFQRILGFSAGAGTRTIREAQPFLGQVQAGVLSAREVIMLEYGLMLYTAILAMVVLLARPLFFSTDRTDQATLVGGLVTVAAVMEFEVGSLLQGAVPFEVETVVIEMAVVALVVLVAAVRGDHDGEKLLVVVWSLFMMAAAFTQVRFNYYLALSVVVLNAYLMGTFLRAVNIIDEDGDFASEIEPYQMMMAILAVLVILPVLVTPFTYYEYETQQGTQTFTSQTAVEIGNSSGPGGITQWRDSLEWMNQSTPREGTYGGADGELEYYGTYEATDDYSYGDGTYGVMSWWDYGHWITVEGERIPTANPFQQGATQAANYLLAPNESHGNDVLERGMEDSEETRYVMIDWQMVDPYGKFSAPTVFYDDADVSYEGDFVSGWHYSLPRRQGGRAVPQYRLNTQRYYESMMVRLYRFNGGRATPKPVVFDWTTRNGTRIIPEDGGFKDFRNQRGGMARAREAVKNDSTGPVNSSTIGGLGHWVREPVPALQHYRLVHASERTIQSGRSDRPVFLRERSRVKVFERVEGAVIEGQGPANSTVRATVRMRIPTRNTTFTYTQVAETGPNGNFQMRVPYSTTGYDNWGPEEGYTNVSVRAVGPYQFSSGLVIENETAYTYRATGNVTEAQVIGEDDSAVQVTLEKQELNLTGGDVTRERSARSGPVETSTVEGTERTSPTDPTAADAPLPADDTGAARSYDGAGGGEGDPTDAVPVPSWLALLVLVGAVLLEVRDERPR